MKTSILALLVSLTALAHEFELEAAPAREPFTDPARAFQQAREELLQHYVKEDLTEADLYRAAVQGMLSRIDPSLEHYNQLLSPADYKELEISMKGQLVGIGVQLNFEPKTGIAEVLGVIPGSPAEKDGIRQGDSILAVNGKSFKDKTFRDMVEAVRGEEGSLVQVETLRDAKVITHSLRRGRVPFEGVHLQRFPGDVAVLSIMAFGEKTPDEVRKALVQIQQTGAKAVVIDLRDNAGGLLEQSLETAKLLLPKGSVVAKLVHRGNKQDTVTVTKDPAWTPLPAVVLVSGDTMSSGELLAAALRQGLHAPLIGTKTKGKWSVQSLKELPNHYVMKYTVAMFQAPDGQSYEGTGLQPDVEIPMDKQVRERTCLLKDPATRLAQDVELRAAVNLMRMRP